MKFSFSGNRKFVVKVDSTIKEYPLSAIDCFLSTECIENSETN